MVILPIVCLQCRLGRACVIVSVTPTLGSEPILLPTPVTSFVLIGFGGVMFTVKHYHPETGLFMVRVLQSCASMVGSSLALATQLAGVDIAIVSCGSHGRESLCLQQLLEMHDSEMSAKEKPQPRTS